MRCLVIPVDHRLRNLISKNCGTSSSKPSEHVRLLREIGESVRVEFSPGNVATNLSLEELDFGLELSRPETTGGVVVVLYHPDRSQSYENGYTAEESRCATLAAVRDLIVCTTLGAMDSDNVTILDSMPFMDEDFDVGDRGHIESHKNFLRVFIAKAPSVVVSCFSSDTQSKSLKLIRHWGVGTQQDGFIQLPETLLRFNKVNALHPGFAINHHPQESCFRRLLILQFAKAFGIWRSNWEEQPFMEELRQTSASLASRYHNCKPECLPQLERDRFRQTLDALSGALTSLRYFDHFAGKDSAAIEKSINDSNLTWLLCDCGLFLGKSYQRRSELDHQHFRQRSEDWLDAILGHRSSDSPDSVGLRDHRVLLSKRSILHSHYARQFQDLLYTWSRQVNLGFRKAEKAGHHNHDFEAHSNAMLRFASGIEDLLARGDGIHATDEVLEHGLRDLNLI